MQVRVPLQRMRVPALRTSVLSCTGAATEPAQKPKRSFEDIMGGGAATSLGFGSALTVPQGFGAPSGTISPAAGMAYSKGPLIHNTRQQSIAFCVIHLRHIFRRAVAVLLTRSHLHCSAAESCCLTLHEQCQASWPGRIGGRLDSILRLGIPCNCM